MKKVRIGGLIALLLMIAIIISLKMMPVNTSFIDLVGKEWKSVILYYYGDEMVLNEEEIQKVYDIFSDMGVKGEEIAIFNPFKKKGYGTYIDIIYINGKCILINDETIKLGIFKYRVSGNPDYVEQLFQLEKEFAAARGIPLKN